MSNISKIFPGFAKAQWWLETEFQLRWSAERLWDTLILEATGEILVWLPGVSDDARPTPCGTISIAKVALRAACDAGLVLDDCDAEYGALVEDMLDGQTYADDFREWCETTHGVSPSGDPVLITDLQIDPRYKEVLQPAATYAVLEAALAFGGCDSVIVGFAHELVTDDLRAEARRAGLWAWTSALRAQPWKQTLVAVRPKPRFQASQV